MKKILSLISSILICSISYGQVIMLEDNTCTRIVDLLVDGELINKLDDCTFEMPTLIANKTYELEVRSNTTSAAPHLSTHDEVLLYHVLLDIQDDPLLFYLGDIDQDGAVSTYDLLRLRAIIRFEDVTTPSVFHVIKADTEIPEIDKFDIQEDYSTLQFTSADFTSDTMSIRVLQLGNLDESF